MKYLHRKERGVGGGGRENETAGPRGFLQNPRPTTQNTGHPMMEAEAGGEATVLSLVAEWFDDRPQLLRRFLLRYHPGPREVELTEVGSGTGSGPAARGGRRFLRRTPLPPPACPTDLRPGGIVVLLSRTLRIVDYGDARTREALEGNEERAVVTARPGRLAEVIEAVEGRGREEEKNRPTVAGMAWTDLALLDLDGGGGAAAAAVPPALAEARRSLYPARALGGGEAAAEEAVVVVFRGRGSIGTAREALEGAGLLRGGRKEEETETEVHCCGTAMGAAEAERLVLELRCQFSRRSASRPPPHPHPSNCTCVIVKPHAVKEGLVGQILRSVQAGGRYRIVRAATETLDRDAAAEFLAAYRAAVPALRSTVEEMCSGPVVVLEVVLRGTGGGESSIAPSSSSSGVVESFRGEVAGPWDVEVARRLRPDSIRGRFGVDNHRNAIHCTDLEGDGRREVDFFFFRGDDA